MRKTVRRLLARNSTWIWKYPYKLILSTMKKEPTYEVIKDGIIRMANEASRGEDIFYRCGICSGIVSSVPSKSIGCPCRNICIDVDYLRLAVRDGTKFQVVRKISPSQKRPLVKRVAPSKTGRR
jgi:hypothetical protein